LTLCAGACACTVGPDFKPPVPPAASGYTRQAPADTAAIAVAGGTGQHFSADADIPAQWWSLFHSEALDGLVSEALARNPDLEAAQAAVKVAMENVKAQIGSFYPSVMGAANVSRNQNATILSPTLSSAALLYNLYQAQLNVSWSPDIWGQNKRQVEALQAAADAQRFQLDATYVALTSNLAVAVIQQASLREQIAANQAMIGQERKILDIQRRQQALGQIAGADVATQEVVLAQTEQALPPLQKQLAQQDDLVAALTGHMPMDQGDDGVVLSALTLPGDLPLSLPSRLVEQRADVRAAEENLHMASAEIGVAMANQLPNITLSANAGTVATAIGQILSSGTGFWSFGAGATGTIFDAGALAHRTQAARDTYEQVAAQYRSTVLGAFQNVADALNAIENDSAALKTAAAAEDAASRSLAIARRQQSLGQTSALALLVAQQAEQQTRLAVIQAQTNRFTDTVALFQALGGGWWNAPDLTQAKANSG
jgi:NodT family efflux transporter outer membrane factor (OMF) lipoprotein